MTTTTLAGREAARLAFGTMRLAGAEGAQVRACLDAAAEAGLGILDTAPIYGTGGPGFGDVETRLGAAWRGSRDLRDAFLLVTKAGILPGLPYDSSAPALTASCDESLRRLGTDRIDLFLVHRPDPLTGPAEVAGALDALVASGKVGAVGVSNYTPAQQRALARHLTAPLAVNQVELSPVAVSALFDGTLDLCQEVGTVPMAWSPLGGGRLLTGDGATDREAAIRAALGELDPRLDVAALAWLLAHPAGIVPVLGTARPERIAPAAEALDFGVDRPAWFRVLEAALGHPMP